MTPPPDDDILDLLTAYALGALEPPEIVQVGALLAERPDLRQLLAELRATADRLPYGLAEAEPAADLRQRALDRATGRSAPQPQPAPGIAARAAVGARARRDRGAGDPGGGAGVGTAGGRARRSGPSASTAGHHAGSAQPGAGPGCRGPAGDRLAAGASGSGAILKTRAGATVLVTQLPPLQPGRVYQLWRIQGSRAPASAGLFTVSGQGYGQTTLPASQQPQPGETVAVTDEPDGGSPGPTTSP
ncbi:MAG: anti-sigma factor [Kouleothrix sp.]|nr:anti-sigma factor [Kouleothrix sp.]